MNDNDKYPQLTAFLSNYILPENAASLPRQAYVSKDGKRKQTEYQPYILVSNEEKELQPIVICWSPPVAVYPIEFTMDGWRKAQLVEGYRIVSVAIPKPSDVILGFRLPTGWHVAFIVPCEFAEDSLSWKP